MEPEYIYRHETDKPLYEVSEDNMSVTVTEDHSLFTDEQKKIKPSEIKNGTKLEYYNKKVVGDKMIASVNETWARHFAKWLIDGTLDRVAIPMFNTENKEAIKAYLDTLEGFDLSKVSKTCRAGIEFLKNRINN